MYHRSLGSASRTAPVPPPFTRPQSSDKGPTNRPTTHSSDRGKAVLRQGSDLLFSLSGGGGGGVNRVNSFTGVSHQDHDDAQSMLPQRRRVQTAGHGHQQPYVRSHTLSGTTTMPKPTTAQRPPLQPRRSTFVESLRTKLPAGAVPKGLTLRRMMGPLGDALGDGEVDSFHESPIEDLVRRKKPLSAIRRQSSGDCGSLGPTEVLTIVGRIEEGPESAESHKTKGNAHYEAGRYKEALTLYTRAIETDCNNPAYFTNRAAANLMLAGYDACVRDCLQALVRDPNSVKAHCRMAKAYMLLGQLKMARRHYESAVPLCGDTPQGLCVQGELGVLQVLADYRRMFDSCNFKTAMEHITRAYEVVQDPPILVMKLHTLIHLDPVEARGLVSTHLEEAKVSGAPHLAELMHLMAKACFYSGNHFIDVAVTYAKQAVAQRGDLKQCHYLLKTITFVDKRINEAHAFYQASKWAEAAASYTLAATADPLNNKLRSVLYCNRAAANMMLGNVVDAMKDCTLAVDADPSNARALARRSRAYEELADYPRALRDMEAAARAQDVFADDLTEMRARAVLHDTPTAQHHTPRMPSSARAKREPVVPAERTHYDALGIDARSDLRAIRRRYHELTLQCHPDKCVGRPEAERATLEERFKEITRVYVTLSDTKSRSDYDASLAAARHAACPTTPTTNNNNSNIQTAERYYSQFF